MRKYIFAAALLVFTFVLGSAQANVSLKNGNYFTGFVDMTLPGGIEPKIERVYNSKSSHDGIFGFGWGSDYEVHLKISADASVVVYENGGGAQNRFTPPVINQADIDKAVEGILAAKVKSGAGLSAAQAAKEKEALRTDARYRNDEWEKLFRDGKVKSRQLADGTVLKSTRFSYQTITKIKEGYIRRYDNGQVQTFDNAGRLTRMADKNGNFVNLTYNKTGQLATLQDNLNRRMSFTFNRAGKVEKITSEGKTCIYKYQGPSLVYAKDSDGKVFEYKYSSDGRVNLVEIKFQDKTTIQVGYNAVDKGETVKWQKDRDGSLTEYTYGGDPGQFSMHYWTASVTKGPDGKVITKNRHEYWEKAKADGERYTYKLASEVDGEKTETIYNECCSLPLEIVRNGEKTSFEYDAKGHVTKKITPGEVTELAYDAKHSKVSKVVKYSKTDKSKPQWAEYSYDDKGNLAFAKNSEGKGVKIVYDHNGRIKALVDQDKRRLEFVYNEASRPVEIKDPAVGKITVEYTNSGDIKKVNSSGGRKIALQVTSAFQNLLDIIRPAGVTLSF